MSRLRSPRNIENLINHRAVFFIWLLEIPKPKDLKGKGKVAESCLILCNPMDCIVPGQTFSRASSQSRDWTQVSRIAGGFFTAERQGKLKNTGVGSLSLLQRIFPVQQWNHGLPHCMPILYQLSKPCKFSSYHCGCMRWRASRDQVTTKILKSFAAVHGVAKPGTTERLHFHFSLSWIGEGNGNPLQCSCLENPRDGGA